MLEAIKKLKGDMKSELKDPDGLFPAQVVNEAIDRAVRIASEHHLRKVEEAYKLERKKLLGKPNIPMLSASRQAHEELTGEKVKTE